MDEISQLIKEAKPLYFKQKRAERNAKIALCSVFLMLAVSFSTYTAINIKTSNIVAEYKTSHIEEMGLPVDEYGLLMVE